MLSGIDLPLHYATEMWVPTHSDAARALEASLRAQEGAPITFRVFGRPADSAAPSSAVGGEDSDAVEMGHAAVRLRTLLSCGGDMLRERLPLLDARGGGAGELSLSVLASEATTRLFGVRSWAGEAIRLVVHGVSLDDPQASARMLLPPGEAKAAATSTAPVDLPPALLWLEADLMGLVPASTGLKSKEISRRLHEIGGADASGAAGATAAGRGARLELFADWEVSLTEGSEPLNALREALRSEEEQDSDVYFVVKAKFDRGKNGKRGGGKEARKDGGKDAEEVEHIVELGTAHFNLEESLRLGTEPSRQRLPLVVQTTGQRVGWITCSVSCLDAMRWAKRAVDEEANVWMTIGDLALFPQTTQKHAALLAANRVEVRAMMPAALAETLAALDQQADKGAKASAKASAPSEAPEAESSAASASGIKPAAIAYRTPTARLINGKHSFGFETPHANAHAGSAVHAALLSLLDAATSARIVDEADFEVPPTRLEPADACFSCSFAACCSHALVSSARPLGRPRPPTCYSTS